MLDFDAGSPPAGGRSWFFGIGINKYAHFPTLNNAVKDVQDLLALLRERYDILPECIRTLYDEEATHQNIIGAFDQLQREVGEADKLIIYYSGHGYLDKEINKGYWIPTDAGRENTAHYVRNSTVREYIEVIRALHTLLISDSCFSGSLFVRGTSRSASAISELESLPSRWAICSGRHNEEVFDGEPGGNSPFAESILDTLRRNAKKEFNVAKLVDRVVEQTRANYQQLPEGNPLYGVGHKGGQYIFRLRADEADDWATAQATGTLAAFQQFLENHPAGAHAGEARETIAFLEEEAAWEAAKAAHTVLSYYAYDKAYPNGRYNHLALEAIAELEEEAAWQEAQRLDKLSSYRKYTSEYPQGKYRAEADARMEALVAGQQEPALWQQTLGKDTVPAYEAYLKQYPQGTYAVEARSRLADLQQVAAEKERIVRQQQEDTQKRRQEEEAWEAAQATGTEEAYRQFLLRYPRGAFAAEAKAAVDKAKAVQEARPPVRPREEKALPVAAARPQPPPAKTQIHKKPLPRRWLPMAAGGVGLILLIWGIGKISGGLSGVLAKPVLEVFEENGKFGYRNASGKIIIPARFDEAQPFQEGKAQVTLEGQIYSIDTKGAYIGDSPEERDQAAWAEAERFDSLDGYQAYQRNFPSGRFYDEAQKRVNQFPPSTVTLAGKTYRTVRLGGTTWLAQNLDYEIAEASWYHKGLTSASERSKYGRLYTWDAAKKACAALGNRWHLSTLEEWRRMTKPYGGANEDGRYDAGKTAYEVLIDGGSSGFSALLGGYGGDIFGDLGHFGSYWTATGESEEYALLYSFSGYDLTLSLGGSVKKAGFSCRCVQDPPSTGND